MNILFMGDVTAESGRKAVSGFLPVLIKKYDADFVIVNGENADHGKGITKKIYQELKEAGADVITLGNHAFSKKEIRASFDECPDMIRPANIKSDNVGRSVIIKDIGNKTVAVMNVVGSVFMNVCDENPAVVIEDMLEKTTADVYILDFHGEATSEKAICAYYFKDELTALVGTHTHVQTADERIIDGCAFISDAGMCGPYDSVLGRDVDEMICHYIHHENTKFKPAGGEAVICGVLIRVDDETNRAVGIERIQIRPGQMSAPSNF